MIKSSVRVGVAVLAVLAVLLGTSACGEVVKTGQDTQALWYEDGEFSAQKFQGCESKASRDRKGLGDQFYYYPVGQRTFSFTGREGAEVDPITIKTKDSQQMTVLGFITFELTTDCETLRTFHEEIGLKYGAYFAEGRSDSSGWNAFLNDYLAVPLNSVMDKAGLQQNWRTLYSDSTAVATFETYVQENIGAEVQAAIGNPNFMKVKTVSIETPQPSKALLDSLEKVEQAKADKSVQEQKNEVAKSKYAGFAACRKVMSEQSCLISQLAEEGKVPFYPIPPGGDINVQQQKPE